MPCWCELGRAAQGAGEAPELGNLADDKDCKDGEGAVRVDAEVMLRVRRDGRCSLGRQGGQLCRKTGTTTVEGGKGGLALFPSAGDGS